MATLHYASGGSAAEVAGAGFNLADVQYLSQVNELPSGMKGLVYLSAHDGVTSSFIEKVTPFLNNPKVFGFFLMDEPDPTGRWGTYASAANLKAESDWIHSHFPGAKTFITMMNMGSSTNPDFSNTYNPANTGIDYYGLDPYPVRTGISSVDYNMIDRAVAAAVKSGIPADKIVPVYQTFGGGGWQTDTGGKHVMPTSTQMQTMIDHWAKLVPSPAFDYAYAWGSQNGDTALENSPELQAVFRQHNLASPSPSTPPPSSEPTTPTPTTPTVPDPTQSTHHIFHGGPGADVFHSTSGDDVYYVNNAHDKVMEASGGGFDKVVASVSYALSAGSHVEQLSTDKTGGTHTINLTGNEFGQAINGNYGANKIDGRGGADTMKGYGGNDTYFVDNVHDKVVEQPGNGKDAVFASVSYALSAGSSVEKLASTQASGTGQINLTGNEFAQTIQGNAGANKINGGGGSDTLTGFGGKDVFVFNTALGSGNIDKITDFKVSQDKIQLDHSVFTGLQQGALSAANFHIGKGAHDGSDHVIYNSSTGALSFDSDGIGGHAQTQFATVAPHLSIGASSFFVV
ncbi:calcium-binding protein [Mesorhizobium sp. ESP6-5]|uniref:calcium-binding protein n=1 Tax=Mesorhizobium sp. ESP6-5 TaxID=2876623 RepID=UPI001CCF42EB|nr:calcium-binding protein [Mesorhizobium sp. ESP6-5]MBZ9758795.1 calcium-binding protein [Mesorhizobium sp. ESP6-5]